MPRIRSLKPEALQHRKVGRLSDRAFRLWIGMLTQADDEGRLILDPDQFRVLCFGYHSKVKIDHVQPAILEVKTAGLIRLYGQSGTIYADFPSWLDHQVVNKPTPSVLPRYESGEPITDWSGNGHGSYQHDLTRSDLIGSDLIGPDLTREDVTIPALIHRDDFETFWIAYPKKTGKGYALTCFLRALPKTTLEIMLDAIRKQRTWPQWIRDGGQFIPNPSTWLNQERWQDEAPKIRGSQSVTAKTVGNLAAAQSFLRAGVTDGTERTESLHGLDDSTRGSLPAAVIRPAT
jgi:hypothetical protein